MARRSILEELEEQGKKLALAAQKSAMPTVKPTSMQKAAQPAATSSTTTIPVLHAPRNNSLAIGDGLTGYMNQASPSPSLVAQPAAAKVPTLQSVQPSMLDSTGSGLINTMRQANMLPTLESAGTAIVNATRSEQKVPTLANTTQGRDTRTEAEKQEDVRRLWDQLMNQEPKGAVQQPNIWDVGDGLTGYVNQASPVPSLPTGTVNQVGRDALPGADILTAQMVEHNNQVQAMDRQQKIAYFLNPETKMEGLDSQVLGNLIGELQKELDEEAPYVQQWHEHGLLDVKDESNVGPEYYQKQQLVEALKNRDSILRAASYGLLGSFYDLAKPLTDAVLGEVEVRENRDSAPTAREMFEYNQQFAQELNPLAYGGGYMGGKMSQYALGSQIMGALPGVGPALGKAGAAVSKSLGSIPAVGSTLTKFITPDAAARLLGDTILDVGLDTIPNAIVPGLEQMESNAEYGGGDLAADVAGNMAANLLFNLGGEAAGQLLSKAASKAVPELSAPQRAAAEALDDVLTPAARPSRLEDAARNMNEVPTVRTDLDASGPVPYSRTLAQEVADNRLRLESMQPVRTLDGTEFAPGGARLSDQVVEYFDSLGNKVTRPDFGDVILDRRGVMDSIGHGMSREKAMTFAAVPDVIKNGVALDVTPNFKNRGYDSAVFGAPVDMNGQRGYVAAVVTKSDVDNRFYVHEVLDSNGNRFKINEKGNSPGQRRSGGDAALANTQTVSIDESIPSLQENSNPSIWQPQEMVMPEVELNWGQQRRRARLARELAGEPRPAGGNLDDLVNPNRVPGPDDLPPLNEVADRAAAQFEGLDDYALRNQEYEELLRTVEKNTNKVPGVGGRFDPDGIPTYTEEGFAVRAQENMQTKGQRAYQQIVSGQAPLERIAKIQDQSKATLTDYAQQVRNAGGTVDYIAEKAMVDRMGAPMGKSWQEFMDMPQTDRNMLNEYMQNLHNIDRLKREMPVLKNTAGESAARAKELARLRPDLADKAKEFQQYNDTFMKEWAVNGNLLSQDRYKMWREMYPDYVPTFRRTATEAAKANAGGTPVNSKHIGTPQPVKSAVGSVEELVPLEDAFMTQVNRIVRAEKKNELLLDLYNVAKQNPDALKGKVEIVPAHSQNEALNFLQSMSLEEYAGKLDETILESLGGSKYRATAFVKGQPVQMEISKDIYDSLTHLFGQYYDPTMRAIMDAGHEATAVSKALITGYNPNFAVRNLFRDIPTGYINSHTAGNTLAGYMYDLAQAGKEMAQNSDDFKLFLANGGARSNFFDIEKGFTRSAAPKTGVAKVADNVKGAFEFVGSNSETVSRFAEFKRALKQFDRTPGGVAKAMQAAADVTVNFARNGPMTKAVDSWVIYLNASVQGLDKIARTLKAHPGRTLRRGAEAIALPTALLWLVNNKNPHYQDLNNRTKDSYFIIPNMANVDDDGNAKTFIKIPKSREWGAVLGATVERSLRAMSGEDVGEAFEGLTDAYIDNYGLSNPATENILAPIVYNIPMNKDWAGRTIVPYDLQDLEPRYQYDYTTSAPAKAVGNLLNMSPKQLDYLFDQYGGFVADVVQPMTSDANKSIPEVLASPWTNAFTANPLYSSNVTDQFYSEMGSANTAAKTLNFVDDLPPSLQTPEEIYARQLSRAQSAMSELRKEEHLVNQEDLARGERVEAVEGLRQEQVEIARSAVGSAQEYTEAYRKYYETSLEALHNSGEFGRLDGEQTETTYKAISSFADEMAARDMAGGELSKWNQRVVDDAAARGVDARELAAEYAVLKAMNGGSSETKILDAYNEGIAPQVYLQYKNTVDPGESGRVTRQQSIQTLLQMGLAGNDLYTMYTLHNSGDKKVEEARATGVAIENYLTYTAVANNFAQELGKESLTQAQNAMLTSALAQAQNLSAQETVAMFNLYGSDKGVEKMQQAYQNGVDPRLYLDYMAMADINENGSVTQEEAVMVLNSLPLSQEQKAMLFQLQNTSWKARPFG